MRAAEFQRVKAEGQSCNGKFMVLSVLTNPECAGARIGLITSRRIGSAVERNAVRRRLREIVRLHMPLLRGGLWLVLIARRGAVPAKFEALREEWLRLAQRASILKAHE